MMQRPGMIERLIRLFAESPAAVAAFVATLGVLAAPAVGLAADSGGASAVAYRDVPGIGSRNLVWIVAQLHLLLAGFVLGVPIFAWLCEVVGWKSGEKRYDKLAKEFTKLLSSAYSTTALFGGILLFILIGAYPKLMAYLSDIFFPSFMVYCALFLLETATLYMYWYGWDAMSEGRSKVFHLVLGFLLNVFAFFIMIIPNSWATFQASPVVIAEGSDMARAWAATWNPTWCPVNIHETKSWGIDIVRTELKEIDPPKDVQETMNKVVKAENEKIAAIDFATAQETMADDARRTEIKKADGIRQARILEAEGEAQAIKPVNEAANQYFIGNAQLLKRLETVERSLAHNAKIVIPANVELINVIGEMAGGILPIPRKEEVK